MLSVRGNPMKHEGRKNLSNMPVANLSSNVALNAKLKPVVDNHIIQRDLLII